MYYVVTGACGFVGANLVKALNERGVTDIIAVDNLKRADKFLNLTDCEIADYLDKQEFLDLVEHGQLDGGVEAVLHQGACSDTMETDGRYMMANNFRYSQTLLDFCMEQETPLLYASSASVYGGGGMFREERDYEAPLNVYGYSKFLFDQVVRRRIGPDAAGADSQIVGFRYFNVYGPREQHKGRMASVAFHHFNQYRAEGRVSLFEGRAGYDNGEQMPRFRLCRRRRQGQHGLPRNPRLGHFQPRHRTRADLQRCGRGDGERLPVDGGQVSPQLSAMLVAEGLVEYIPFPEALKGKYQSFTEADVSRPRPGCDELPDTGGNSPRSTRSSPSTCIEWIATMTHDATWRMRRQFTPLVHMLKQACPAQDNARRCNVVLAKLEGNNPAGSVKDRPALSMIARAESAGDIKPGDTLIEATSGNTGIALAMVAAMRGYRMIADHAGKPESVERCQTMRAYGAELILTARSGGMESARDLAERMVKEGKGVMLDQFANPDNPLAHYEGTGPEIWRDTEGRITHFVSSMGTTGTIMGCSRFLKEKNPAIQIVGCQPEEGSQIPGIRKWPEAYLPRIYDGSQGRPGRERRPGPGRGDDAASGARGRHLCRDIVGWRDGGRLAYCQPGRKRGDRQHHLRPRRPLSIHRGIPGLRACE